MLKARFSREVRRSVESPAPVGANPFGAVGGRKRVGLSPDLRGDAPQTRWDEAPIWHKRFWEHRLRGALVHISRLRRDFPFPMTAMAGARPAMIANLDKFRPILEDLGGGRGVTAPWSDEVALHPNP